jgi:hypothetical protein
MSSVQLGSGFNIQKGNLGGAFDILSGASGDYTDLGIARRFGGSAAAYSLRDIGAMNGRVVKVRSDRHASPEDFSAGAIDSGGIEQFAIGQPILDLYNNAAQFSASTYYVAISTITIGNDSSQSISGKYVFSGGFDVNNARLWSNAAGNHFWYLSSSTNLQIKILNTDGVTIDTHNITLSSALKQNTLYTFSYTRDSNYDMSFSFTDEDGNSITGSKSNTQGSIKIQWIGFRLTGTVRDLNFNNVASYVGDGIENSNWEDGIGSNDGARNTTLVAYTGQGIDAFVDTWYDQSGNGRDATQSTADRQPKIVFNGSITTLDNGTPSLSFIRQGSRFERLNFDTHDGNNIVEPVHILLTVNSKRTAFTYIVSDVTSGGAGSAPLVFLNATSFRYLTNGTDLIETVDGDADAIYSVFSAENGGTGVARRNGTQIGTVSRDAAESDGFAGIMYNPGDDANSVFLESLVIYSGDKSAEIQTIENELAIPIGLI